MEVHDIIQEAVNKTIPKKKTCKKAKWLSEEALQRAEKREAKGKGEKGNYSHLNAEFQRKARRDKKTFLSVQCKEIEENNRMGKTRNLFKKIRDTKETLHAKIGSIKGRNGMDLSEAEDIKKRWKQYTEELYKKDPHDPNQISYNYTVEVGNRFRGLDLIDKVPEELWTEVHDIVQETGSKTIPKKKKC